VFKINFVELRLRPAVLKKLPSFLQPFGISKIKENSIDRIIYLFRFHNKNGCFEIPSKAPLSLPNRGEIVAEKLPRVTFLPGWGG